MYVCRLVCVCVCVCICMYRFMHVYTHLVQFLVSYVFTLGRTGLLSLDAVSKPIDNRAVQHLEYIHSRIQNKTKGGFRINPG